MITRWSQQPCPQLHVSIILLLLCHFEVWNHKFKMAEGRQDAPSTSEYLLNTCILRTPTQKKNMSIFKYFSCFFFFSISCIFLGVKTHLSSPADIMHQRLYSAHLDNASFCISHLKLWYYLWLNGLIKQLFKIVLHTVCKYRPFYLNKEA